MSLFGMRDGVGILPANMGRVLLMRAVLILCQLLLVLISLFYDGIDLALPQLMILITLYIAVNVASFLFLMRNKGLNERSYFCQLMLDVLFLTLLLYFSGGYTNPLISLYLLPLIIVSSTLGRRQAMAMALVILVCYTLLVFFYRPLFVTGAMVGTSGFHMHLLGMWFSFVLSVGLIVFFIMRMSESIRVRDRRLAEMREVAERDSHVLALGAMAAVAAHELGTPLATMAVVSHEMECDYADNREITSQTALLKTELTRCKQVLSQLSASAGQLRAEGGRRLRFDAYMREVSTQWQMMRPRAEIRLRQDSDGLAPELVADITLTQALYNLLNNAADASPKGMMLAFGWNDDSLWLEIGDQGPGFPQYILDHSGQPEISTKTTGSGLGLFLSRAVLERLGGKLELSNPVDGGACAQVILPRSQI